MSLKRNFFWLVYFVVFLLFIIREAVNFFFSSYPTHTYFEILLGFDAAYVMSYTLNFMQVIFSLIHLLPLILYIERIRLFSPELWRILLVFRIIFDLTGHPYEIYQLTAIYQINPHLTFIILIQIIFIYIPSYIACFRYAFVHEKYLI